MRAIVPPATLREPAAGGTRRAVIDIGTNSVKLLIGDVQGKTVIPLLEESDQTRLGQGFYDNQMLQKGAVRATAEAVAEFKGLAGVWGVTPKCIATSAVRDAKNSGELLGLIHELSGLSVEIISGDKEAEWVFEGVLSDSRYVDRTLLIMDVGGGSTEFILGRGSDQQFRNSFRLGTVRLLEQFKPSECPGEESLVQCNQFLEEFLRVNILPELGLKLKSSRQGKIALVGTGGTATILARIAGTMKRFDREKIEEATLSFTEIAKITEELWKTPLAARKRIVGIPPNRADVILMGSAIYSQVMKALGFEELSISTRGLRYAALAAPALFENSSS
ncbi:MAG: Ppx/GppA phosphatase [Verrucomicrobiales bacterium]|nr:Ppx/GppA phosphatase [Verrucomicrobiales bacterium]